MLAACAVHFRHRRIDAADGVGTEELVPQPIH
jgi:hypothetical protein